MNFRIRSNDTFESITSIQREEPESLYPQSLKESAQRRRKLFNFEKSQSVENTGKLENGFTSNSATETPVFRIPKAIHSDELKKDSFQSEEFISKIKQSSRTLIKKKTLIQRMQDKLAQNQKALYRTQTSNTNHSENCPKVKTRFSITALQKLKSIRPIPIKELDPQPLKSLNENKMIIPFRESKFAEELDKTSDELNTHDLTKNDNNLFESPKSNQKGSSSSDIETPKSALPPSHVSIFMKQAEYRKQLRVNRQRKKENLLRDSFNINYFLLLPDDTLRGRWCLILTLCLIYTATVTPYRISFIEEDTPLWHLIDSIVDALYLIDIILNFFSTFYDKEDNLVIDRKTIALHYLRSWFIIDVVSVLPISNIIESTHSDQTSLTRIAKLSRLYRLIRMAKLTRMMKVAKERNKLFEKIKSFFAIKAGFERLMYFVLMMFIVCHITSCIWYFIARYDNFDNETWILRYELQDKGKFEIYIASFYYSITLITTMGDSGIKAWSIKERFLSIVIMCIGVVSYSYALGSLTSVLSALDAKHAKLKEKLNVLDKMREEYQINYHTYIKLRKALKYDYSRNESEKFDLLKELPRQLNVELSVIMHEKIINQIPFFKKKDKHFIAFIVIAPMLKPVKVSKGEFISQVGDPINESKWLWNNASLCLVYFLVKGEAAYVFTHQHKDIPFIKIERGNYFGEMELMNSAEEDEVRLFSVKAMEDCELLLLSKEDLYLIDVEHPKIVEELLENAKNRFEGAVLHYQKIDDIIEDDRDLNRFTTLRANQISQVHCKCDLDDVAEEAEDSAYSNHSHDRYEENDPNILDSENSSPSRRRKSVWDNIKEKLDKASNSPRKNLSSSLKIKAKENEKNQLPGFRSYCGSHFKDENEEKNLERRISTFSSNAAQKIRDKVSELSYRSEHDKMNSSRRSSLIDLSNDTSIMYPILQEINLFSPKLGADSDHEQAINKKEKTKDYYE